MVKFIPGLELSHKFYEQVVKKIMKNFFSKIKYSAGLIDYWSDVMWFDTAISRDHQRWPRLSIFLSKRDFEKYAKTIDKTLSEKLPHEFMGYPTNFSGKVSDGIQRLEKSKNGKINHLIRIHTIEDFFEEHLDYDIHNKITIKDRLLFPQQRLRVLRSGKIFHDDLKMKKIIDTFHYYPKDVRFYSMACEWEKISSEEAFVGRCGDLGDEIWSKIIAARITESIMNLCFMMEQEYIPYSKWFWTAFAKLSAAKKFLPIFEQILAAKNRKEREKYLSKAYETLAKKHNELKITQPWRTKVIEYYGRPYLVIFCHDFAQKLSEKIKNPELKKISLIGSIDQITKSSHIHNNKAMIKKLWKIYE